MVKETMKEKRAKKREERWGNGGIFTPLITGTVEFLSGLVEIAALVGRGIFHVIIFPFKILGSIFDGF